ncbi:hypothetical protein E2C01_101846 [Portunus trituberculatus]|uniref:Uncharacterized protein n=1 Tax=Portunus trituberculatus TaxID=210409 RepID=A0A5B7KMW7_PORTR|nr:hypothetical protein [Portunus trituberculatus]
MKARIKPLNKARSGNNRLEDNGRIGCQSGVQESFVLKICLENDNDWINPGMPLMLRSIEGRTSIVINSGSVYCLLN